MAKTAVFTNKLHQVIKRSPFRQLFQGTLASRTYNCELWFTQDNNPPLVFSILLVTFTKSWWTSLCPAVSGCVDYGDIFHEKPLCNISGISEETIRLKGGTVSGNPSELYW